MALKTAFDPHDPASWSAIPEHVKEWLKRPASLDDLEKDESLAERIASEVAYDKEDQERSKNDAAKETGQDSNNPQTKSAEGDGAKEMQLIIDRSKALETLTDPIQREAVRCEILIAQDKLSSL